MQQYTAQFERKEPSNQFYYIKILRVENALLIRECVIMLFDLLKTRERRGKLLCRQCFSDVVAFCQHSYMSLCA
jgi:hypothetical protein